MDIEQLLTTRYMVVNPFSGRFCRYYEIITEIETIHWIEKSAVKLQNVSLNLPTKKMFLKLKWWQGRKQSEMPTHIKTMSFLGCNRHNEINGDTYIVYEVQEYTPSGFIDKEGRMHIFDTENYQPSTKTEYDKYRIGQENYGKYWDNLYNNIKQDLH